MVLVKNKIFVGVIVFLIILVGLAGSFLYFNDRFQENDDNTVSEAEKEKYLQQIEQEANKQSQSIQEENNNTVNQLQSVADLEAIGDFEKQGEIGISKISNFFAEGKNQEAYPYIDYLVKRDDIYGLEANRMCVLMKISEEERLACEQRANELARGQGIIGPSETLPASYFVYKDGD